MKRVPSGFLPPLRRVARKVSDDRRYPWSPTPRPSMDDVIVVADEQFPAVATALPEDAHSICLFPGHRVVPGSSAASLGASGGPTSSTSLASSRKDSPPVYYCRRGSRCSAVAGLDPTSRCQAMSVFIKDVSAASTADSAVSLVRTWSLFHIEWYGDSIPIFPLTPDSVEAVGALLKRGGYRAAASYCSAAKDRHLAMGFKWSVFLDRSVSRVVRSVTRGIGPPRQSAELDVQSLTKLELPLVSSLSGAPLGLKTALLTGVMWCLREIELSHIRVDAVTLEESSLKVTIKLPTSKTDPTGTGASRSCGCLCAAHGMSHPCPFYLLQAHRAFLVSFFGELDPWMPFFPTAQKQLVSKVAMVNCIVDVAAKLGLSVLDADNAQRFGGHSLRVTGARWLAELGLPLVSIQLLARWEGDVIRRYIAEAPLRRLSEDYLRAAGDHHIRNLLSHSDHEVAGLRSTLSKVTEELWTELRSQRQLSETLAAVLATSTRSIADTPALADVRDDFLEVAAGTLNPRASPATVRTVLDAVLARSGRSLQDLSQTTVSTGMLITST